MRDWLVDVLLDRTTLNRGYFNKSAIEFLLSESAASGRYSKELFCLAVLELWHRTFLTDNERPADSLAEFSPAAPVGN